MILKESLTDEFKSIITKTLKEHQDNINIGLEMELQQNSKETDYNFSLFNYTNPKISNVIIMVIKRNRKLNGNIENEDVKFFKNSFTDYSNLDDFYKDIKIFDDNIGIDYSEISDEFYFLNNNTVKNVETSIKEDIIKKHWFLEKKKGSSLGNEDYAKYYNEFYKTDNHLDRKYTLDDKILATYDNYSSEINDFITDYLNVEVEDLQEDVITEYELQVFSEKINNEEELKDKKRKIIDYFKDEPDIYNQLKKYSIRIIDDYRPNTKNSFFSFESDSSLKPNGEFETTFEFKTPFGFKLKEQIPFFKQFVQNEEKKDFELKPNSSCGFHVNISLDSGDFDINKLDFIILYMLFDEQKLMKETRGVPSIFQQEIKNKQLDKLASWIKNSSRQIIKDINEKKISNEEKKQEILKIIILEFENKIRDMTFQTKLNRDRSFLIKNDRIEFRIMGGNYLKPVVQKYILELQQIVIQQHYKPIELKRYCYKEQKDLVINKMKEYGFNKISDVQDTSYRIAMQKIKEIGSAMKTIHGQLDSGSGIDINIAKFNLKKQKRFFIDLQEIIFENKVKSNKLYNKFIELPEISIDNIDSLVNEIEERTKILQMAYKDEEQFKNMLSKKLTEIGDVEKVMDL